MIAVAGGLHRIGRTRRRGCPSLKKCQFPTRAIRQIFRGPLDGCMPDQGTAINGMGDPALLQWANGADLKNIGYIRDI